MCSTRNLTRDLLTRKPYTVRQVKSNIPVPWQRDRNRAASVVGRSGELGTGHEIEKQFEQQVLDGPRVQD